MKKATNFGEMIGVFNPFPLEGEEYKEFYVDTSGIRSVMNASKAIVNTLIYNPNPYTKLLFMGHKGCGKSTEIIHISERLESKYEIIRFSIAQDVELMGIQYIDVIFAIMGQTIEYLLKQKEIKVDEKILERLVTYWKGEQIFEENIVDDVELEAGGEANLSFLKKISLFGKSVLKTGVETKRTIRSVMEPKIGLLIKMINEILDDINKQLKEKKNKELLVIVEDLDKLDIEGARHIFVLHRKSLISLNMKMIISFPIYLVYNTDFAMIRDDFDSCVLYSMIKVNNADRSINVEGRAILKEIVYKRMDEHLIADDALEYMIEKSGGAIRDLFYMIREAALFMLGASDGQQPIDVKVAQTVANTLKTIYERNIASKEQFDRLIEIYEDPHPIHTDLVLSELLKTLSIIEYNGERWCGVHPVLIDFLREKGRIS